MSMIKVMIVDDHPLVREGLKKVVSKGSMDIEARYEASNAAEMQEMLSNELPDVVIVAVAMPGRSGMDVVKDIKNLYPELPVLTSNTHPQTQSAPTSMKPIAAR